jgi:hypothetical protein
MRRLEDVEGDREMMRDRGQWGLTVEEAKGCSAEGSGD